MSAPRIVSLLPSATEIVCALGLETHLVGVSPACDASASFADLPRLSASPLDAERVRALAPDIIVAPAPYEALPPAQAVSLNPQLLHDIWADIRVVGRAAGRLEEADAVLAACFERVNEVIAETIMIPQPPRVAAIAWLEPLMLAGRWMPELIQLAGGRDGLRQPGAPASAVDWRTLQAYDPETLLVMPCGYTLEQTVAQARALAQLPGWEALTAVRQGRVYAVDGHAGWHRPGPRIVEALEVLSALIHPDIFSEFLQDRDGLYAPLG